MLDPKDSHPQELTFHEYLDNELSSSERTKFNNHLSNCQECAHSLSTLEDLFAQIGGLPSIEYANDISLSVVEEINHFIEIEPLLKRTTWAQIGIVAILMATLFSLVSIDTIQSVFSQALNNLGVSLAANVSTLSEFFASLPSQFPGVEIHFFYPWELVSSDYLSAALLLAITVGSGLLWFVGNRILLPNSSISHSPNGG